MRGYRQITGPLIEQLKKDYYIWNEEVEHAFHQLREVMTVTPQIPPV